MKSLIVVNNENQYFFPFVPQNIEIHSVRKPLNAFFHFLAALCLRLNINAVFSYASWYKRISSYDQIVFFETAVSTALIKQLKKKVNNRARIVFYLWNPLKNDKKLIQHILQLKKIVPIYSYDPVDCQRFNLFFAPMLYTRNLKLPNVPQKNDLVFLGYAKGRESLLKKIYNYCAAEGLKTDFHIVSKEMKDEQTGYVVSSRRVSYGEYLQRIACSRAILDLVQEGQSGLSLRALESLFLKKKLITNNSQIEKYDFFRPENIYVLKSDNIQGIKDFLQAPCCDIDEKILFEYDIEKWIERLG